MPETLTQRSRNRTNKQDMEWPEEQAKQNVGKTEGWASLVIGSLLVARGFRGRSWLSVLISAAGAALVYRGATRLGSQVGI